MKNDLNNKKEFMDDIIRAKKHIIGTETYGDLTEFYDEDNCVILTIKVNPENNSLIFNFILSGNTYEYEEKEMQSEEMKESKNALSLKININQSSL